MCPTAGVCPTGSVPGRARLSRQQGRAVLTPIRLPLQLQKPSRGFPLVFPAGGTQSLSSSRGGQAAGRLCPPALSSTVPAPDAAQARVSGAPGGARRPRPGLQSAVLEGSRLLSCQRGAGFLCEQAGTGTKLAFLADVFVGQRRPGSWGCWVALRRCDGTSGCEGWTQVPTQAG